MRGGRLLTLRRRGLSRLCVKATVSLFVQGTEGGEEQGFDSFDIGTLTPDYFYTFSCAPLHGTGSTRQFVVILVSK